LPKDDDDGKITLWLFHEHHAPPYGSNTLLKKSKTVARRAGLILASEALKSDIVSANRKYAQHVKANEGKHDI
jgi:hypothetical protein